MAGNESNGVQESSSDPSVADLIAELDAMDSDPGKPVEESGVSADDEPADDSADTSDDDEAKEGVESDDEPEEDADGDEDEEEEDGDSQQDDPQVAKRIDEIQKAEKRSKDQIEEQRNNALREVEAKREELEREWSPKFKEAERVRGLIERARVDPAALSDELGWDEETELFVAQALFANAKAKKGDPKFREQAARIRREREATSKTSELEKQVRELSERLERQDSERAIDSVVSQSSSSLTDETPIMRSMFSKNPAAATSRVRAAVSYIKSQTGETPKISDVISKLEEIERQELVDRGIDVDAVYKTSGKTKKKPKPSKAGEKTAAKETFNGKQTKTPAAAPTSGAVTREQLISELDGMTD